MHKEGAAGVSFFFLNRPRCFRHALVHYPLSFSLSLFQGILPANQETRKAVKEKHGEDSWRNKLLVVLHHSKVEIILMALLFFDVLALFTEVFLQAYFPPCRIIERDCLACCLLSTDQNNTYDRLLGGSAHTDDVCSAGYDIHAGGGYPSCDESKYHTIHVVEEVLFWITISILCLFFLEVNLEMIAIGPCEFFRKFFYCLVISFVISDV